MSRKQKAESSKQWVLSSLAPVAVLEERCGWHARVARTERGGPSVDGATARVAVSERRASNLVVEGDTWPRRAERVGAQRARGDLVTSSR